MMRGRLIAMLCTVGVVLTTSSAALATAPSNDTFAGATTIPLGFTQTADTSEATTDSTDVDAQVGCMPPATDASVWYDFTPASNVFAEADVSGSDYSAGVMVVTGSPGNFAGVACDPLATGWRATAGTTYHILAFDDQSDGGGNGGTLRFALRRGPTFGLALDDTGGFTKAGVALVRGTLRCSDASFETELFVSLSQTVGRVTIRGVGSKFDLVCDGVPHRVTVRVPAENGTFKGGQASVKATPSGCDEFVCNGVEFRKTIQLKGA